MEAVRFRSAAGETGTIFAQRAKEAPVERRRA
jgi:hypothetical protein